MLFPVNATNAKEKIAQNRNCNDKRLSLDGRPVIFFIKIGVKIYAIKTFNAMNICQVMIFSFFDFMVLFKEQFN